MQCTQQVSDKLSGSVAVVLQGPTRSHKPRIPRYSQPRIPQYQQPRVPRYQVSTIQDEKDQRLQKPDCTSVFWANIDSHTLLVKVNTPLQTGVGKTNKQTQGRPGRTNKQMESGSNQHSGQYLFPHSAGWSMIRRGRGSVGRVNTPLHLSRPMSSKQTNKNTVQAVAEDLITSFSQKL